MLPSLSQMKQYFGIDAATCITSRLLFPYLNDFIIKHFHKQAKLLFVQKLFSDIFALLNKKELLHKDPANKKPAGVSCV